MAQTRAKTVLASCVSAALIGLAVAAGAQKRPLTRVLPQDEVQKQLGAWERKYQEVVTDLKAGDRVANKRARKHAAALFEDIVDRTVSAGPLAQTAGRVLTLLAIAEFRLGDRDAAAWHWQMAQFAFVDLRGLDFLDYPDAMSFMKENVIPDERLEQLRREHRTEKVETPRRRDNIVPPSLKKKVAPDYPPGLAGQFIGGETVVEAVIDAEGKVRNPLVERSCGHLSADLAALEALREWRYQPATLNGKPVSVFLTVTMSFKPMP